MEIEKKIQKFINENGITQEFAAKIMGLKPANLSATFKGRRRLKADELLAYNIYEEPQEFKDSAESEIPTRAENLTESDFPSREDRVGSTESEEPEQLNTKKRNTKKSNIKDKKIKNPYGQFSNVYLTDEHIEKLLKIYKTEDLKNKAIEILSSYKAAKGKTYKNDYAVLNEFNWVYQKIFSKKSNERNSAGENKKIEMPVPDYEKNSRW